MKSITRLMRSITERWQNLIKFASKGYSSSDKNNSNIRHKGVGYKREQVAIGNNHFLGKNPLLNVMAREDQRLIFWLMTIPMIIVILLVAITRIYFV